MINLIQCRKTEYTFVKQASFHDLNANNAFLGLREKLYFPILVPNMVGKFGANVDMGGYPPFHILSIVPLGLPPSRRHMNIIW